MSGDFNIKAGATVTIDGVGANDTKIGGSNIDDRLLQIAAGATVTLTDLFVGGGRAPTGGSGGGISNQGSLTLVNVVVTNNRAGGSAATGGGIHNAGTLTLTDSRVAGNQAGPALPSAGAGGRGGGIFSASGTVTLLRSTVTGNIAGDGTPGQLPGPDADGGPGGAGGDGGGIFNAGPSTLTLTDSTVSQNRAGNGGGILVSSPWQATDVTVSGNSGGKGGTGGNSGSGDNAGSGGGGVADTTAGAGALLHVTVAQNAPGPGAPTRREARRPLARAAGCSISGGGLTLTNNGAGQASRPRSLSFTIVG